MNWFVCGVVAVSLTFTLTACGDDDPVVRDAATGDAAENDAGGEDSGSTDASTDAPAMSCGELMGRTAECQACLQTNCCTELGACNGDTSCSGLVQCLRACDDPDASTDCMSACVGTHGVSPAYNPLLLCGADDCMTECPFASP